MYSSSNFREQVGSQQNREDLAFWNRVEWNRRVSLGLGVGTGARVVGVCVGVGVCVCVGAGAGARARAGEVDVTTPETVFSQSRSSSSSKLVKLESEDKLLHDAELRLEEFESDLGRPDSRLRPSSSSSSDSPSPHTAKRRRATSNHFLIPLFLAFQSANTHVGQCWVRFEDPAGILWVQEGVVHGRGAVAVVAAREMAGDGMEDRAVEGGGRGIGRGVRLAARGTAVYGSETTGMQVFPWVLDLGPGLVRFLPMIGAGA